NGAIPMDSKRYDRIYDFYYGELEELYEMMFSSRDGITVQLTGKQLALANRIVMWASETRAESCVRAGKTEYLQYC
ncbi:MAG: hypothetical protein IKU30_05760, partial [Clostridia bacterium]|nr:hypothetical protein [Clostridia bacterium]